MLRLVNAALCGRGNCPQDFWIRARRASDNMNISMSIFLPLSAALLATASDAQITTHSVTIGGPASCSSAGFNDPGLLDDGLTPASATYVFTLDAGTNTLTLVVRNTSPVTLGVPNPLLTDLFFNTPTQVTAVGLVSQTSTSGVAPSYALSFDADLATNPNPNGADGFGAFSVALSDTGNIQGTIANPNADTYTVAAALLAISPCTFTLSLTGNLAGLTAVDFTTRLSVIPPGNKPSRAVGKFQAGGAASASAFINDGHGCPSSGTSTVLGSPCGGTLAVSPPVPGGFSTVTYTGSTPLAPAVLAFSRSGGTPFPFQGCTLFLRTPSHVQIVATNAAGDFQLSYSIPSTHTCGQAFVLQAFVVNPVPMQPLAEISNGVLVTMGN